MNEKLKRFIERDGIYLILIIILLIGFLMLYKSAQSYERATWKYYQAHIDKCSCPNDDNKQMPIFNISNINILKIGDEGDEVWIPK